MQKSWSKIFSAIVLACLSVYGQELLENRNFSKTAADGRLLSWNLLNGTRANAEQGILTIRNTGRGAVATQYFRPPPGKRILFSAELKNESCDRIRAYVEFIREKSGKKLYSSAGTQWHEAQAGKWYTLKNEITLPPEYQLCYLAVMNEKGDNLSIRNPKAEITKTPLIRNADFSMRTQNGSVSAWVYRGKAPESLAYSGGTAKLASGFIIQSGLPLKAGQRYTLSYSVRGETGGEFRSYVEWNKKDQNGKAVYGSCTGNVAFQSVPGTWKRQEYTFKFPLNGITPYIVFGSKNTHFVEFKDIVMKEAEVIRDMGGVWNLHGHKKVTDGILITGKQPAAVLRGIPVVPGKRYAIYYDVALAEDPPAESSAFFQIRTHVTPTGLIGANAFTDALLSRMVQKCSHVFTVPPESDIHHVSFSIRGTTPGVMKFNNFRITEVEIKQSDSWNLTLTKPFYRDSFYHGDDDSVIEGNAAAAGADRIRIHFQGKTSEFPVSDGKAAIRLPFGLPYGKYELKCEFLKNSKVEKSISRVIGKYPEAPHTVTVLPNRRVAFNGKPFFPVYEGGVAFTPESLYTSARSGVNMIFCHMAQEKKLLEYLDLAHRFGLKVTLYPSPPANAAGLNHFKRNVKECITERVKAHPALFAYHLPDEPLLAGVPLDVIEAEYQFLKEHDPYHPVWINSAPRNEIQDLKPYADASDIFGVDIYPIPYPGGHSGLPDKMPTVCGKYAQRMNETGSYKRPIWVFLQGFAWHEAPESIERDNVKPSPHPSLSESRFMAYDVLLNGGTGYFLWGNQFVRSEAFVSTLRKMYREMYRISGLFAYGTQLDDLKTSNPAVRCAVMELNGKKYYFLMNLTDKKQDAVTGAKGKVLLSDSATFSNGKVSLPAFEVLICSEHQLPEPAYRLPAPDPRLEHAGDPVLRRIREKNAFLKAPRYSGKANWIWYRDGQHGLARCFAGKTFEVKQKGEKVLLKVAADDAYTVYLNGEKIGEGSGWNTMYNYNLTDQVTAGRNTLVILGIDQGAAPCAILAELNVGSRQYPSDQSWKVIPAYKYDQPPADFSQAASAVILAPYGKGAWGRGVRIMKQESSK